MSLKGSLQTVALPEVLQLLSSTGKSGALHVAGTDGAGRFWFSDGRMAAFSAGRAEEPLEAVFELLRIPQGEFSFTAGEEPTDDAVPVTGPDEMGPILEAAQERLAEWLEIVEVVPSLDHHVELAAEPPADGVTIERGQWAIVVAVGDGRSVRDVLVRADYREFDGFRAVRSGVEAGLLVISDPVTAPAVVGASSQATPVEEVQAVDNHFEAVEDWPVVEDDHVTVVEDEHFAVVEVEPAEAEAPAVDPFLDVDSLPGSMLRFGVDGPSDDSAVEDAASGFDGSLNGYADYSSEDPVAGGADETPAGLSPEAEDRYAALRAAILEVNVAESLVDPNGSYQEENGFAGAFDEAPAEQAYAIGTEPDGRAALHALLSEVSGPGEEEAGYAVANGGSGWDAYEAATVEAAGLEPVDGLADRGPWTEHELAAMDADSWSANAEPETGGELVTFGSPSPEADAGEFGAVEAPVEVAEAVEEPAAAPEEPMNRGLLLKFLSSVRN